MERNFVVYKSSAGSGKTFTLVKEYLILALGNPNSVKNNYKRILALTFTNKAAAEMRIRIVNALIDIVNQKKDNHLGKELQLALRIGQVILQERAQQLISNLLHHYSDFAVSTIDSFSHKIVKTFAHDLKLPVNFNLQTDSSEFYEKVISQLFSELGENNELTDLLKGYVIANLNNESNWDPEQDIQKFADLLQKESSLEHIESLSQLTEEQLQNIKTIVQHKIQVFQKEVKDISTVALNLINDYGLSDEDFNYKTKGPQNFFKKCYALELDMANINSYVQAAIKGKWAGSNLGSDKVGVFNRISEELTGHANKLIELHTSGLTKYNLYLLLQKRLFLLQLLRKIQSIASQLKQDEQLVFIEEFNSKIYEFVKNEPVSFIYERLGERYKHFLIDEFQDTSTLQWQNILPLIDNSLAAGHFNLVVGDGKQSIYRWRNANVTQFALLPRIENALDSLHLKEKEASLIRNYQEEKLSVNYRSFKTIIEFNNTLFDYLRDHFLEAPFNTIYNHQKQEFKNHSTGYVTIINQKIKTDKLQSFHEEQTLERIKNCLNAGYRYSDICVLTRNNKSGSSIATYLNQQSIPVVSSDSLLLKNCTEINVLSAFFKHIQNRNNHVSASVVINYLRVSGKLNTETQHHCIQKLKTHKLTEILENLNITVSENEITSKNILDTAIYLIDKLQLNSSINSNIYIRFFLDEISKYMVSHNSNINEFNDWWEKRSEKASLIISENMNAVKIMTIHASKGLEFPVVIIPHCNWSFRHEEKWVDVEEENIPIKSAYIPMDKKAEQAGLGEYVKTEKQEILLDNINILYVAFTRAAEQLHVISSPSESNKKEGIWQIIDQYLKNQTILKPIEFGYELGEPVRKKETPGKNTTPIQLEKMEIQEQLSAIKIKGSFLKNADKEEGAREKGIILHYILSKIKTFNDIENAVIEVCMEGIVSEPEIPELITTLSKLLLLPELKPYFSNNYQYKSERELLTHEGELLRPDRIAFSEKETCIIDYKTGKEDLKKHQSQMLKYEKALMLMNYKNIKKILVYVENFKVIELS